MPKQLFCKRCTQWLSKPVPGCDDLACKFYQNRICPICGRTLTASSPGAILSEGPIRQRSAAIIRSIWACLPVRQIRATGTSPASPGR